MEKKFMQEIEFRALEDLRVRARVNDFGISEELTGKGVKFREQIPKEVWTRALEKMENLKVHFNHRTEIDIAQEVRMEVLEDGVYADIKLHENARELYNSIKQGKTTGMSFGFRALKDRFEQMGNYLQRTIEDMNLFEISILDVTPAYRNTMVEARQIEIPFEHDLDIKKKQLELLKML